MTFPSNGNYGDGSFQVSEDPMSFETTHSGSATRVNLHSLFLTEDVDAKKIYVDWFTATGDDWASREKDFVELLFHSIGWLSFSYSDFKFRTVRAYITQERTITTNPALNATYLQNYDGFMECLFVGYNFSNDSGALQFLTSAERAVGQLMLGSYDSYRVIAVRTGMKILTSCFKSLWNFERDSSSSGDQQGSSADRDMAISGDTLDSSASRTHVAAPRPIKKIKETMTERFFPNSIRDVCQEVRQIVYSGMLAWSGLNPPFLLDSRWQRYIIFGINDDPDLYMISVLKNIFEDNTDTAKQRELLKKIHKTLIRRLVECEDSSNISMEILSSAARYLDVTNILPQDVVETVYVHVYHPDKAIAVIAAKFLFYSKMTPHGGDTSLLLTDLVFFNAECADLTQVSSEELLVDSFGQIMGQFVKWEHWLELFYSCPPELVTGSAKLFINYVRKVTTNYCPIGRSKTVGHMPRKDFKEARDGFTTFLSAKYKTILSMNKIRVNPEAQSLIIRSMVFFARKISSNVALEILSFLISIRSNTTPGMMASCWSTLAHLTKIVTFDTTGKMQFNALWDSLRSHTIQKFIDYVNFPSSQPDNKLIELDILGLIKCGELSVSVWDCCCANLQSFIDHNPNSAAISVIVKVLYVMVFHQYKLIDRLVEDPEKEDGELNVSSPTLSESDNDPSRNLTMLTSRFSKLQIYAVMLMGKEFELHVRVEAFHVLASALECFGKHMVQHPNLGVVCDIVDDRVETLLVEFSCEVMKWGPNEDMVRRGVCCEVLMRTAPQFGSNYLDIRKISDLLVLITQQRPSGAHIERHGVEVMSALKLFMTNFPDSSRRVALVVFRGVCGVTKDTISENSLELRIDKVKKTIEFWRTFEDFEKVIRSPLVRQTIMMMFQELVDRTGFEGYKKLSESFPTQSPSRFGAGRFLVRCSATADETSSMVVDAAAAAQDSVVNYSAFRRGIGHSMFRDPIASTPREIGNSTDS